MGCLPRGCVVLQIDRPGAVHPHLVAVNPAIQVVVVEADACFRSRMHAVVIHHRSAGRVVLRLVAEPMTRVDGRCPGEQIEDVDPLVYHDVAALVLVEVPRDVARQIASVANAVT
jgi:hypothetical protein